MLLQDDLYLQGNVLKNTVISLLSCFPRQNTVSSVVHAATFPGEAS